ncbi:phosphatidate cytidylyltransferase [Pseudochelatococcus sp. B33]
MTGSRPADPPSVGDRRRSELRRRVVSAVTLAAAAVAATWYGGIPFAALWAVAGTCVVAEWFALIAPNADAASAGGDWRSGAPRLRILRFLTAAAVGALPLLTALELRTAAAVSAAAALIAAAGWVVLARGQGSADANWRQRFGDQIVVWALSGLLCGALVGLVPVLARATPAGAILVAWMFAVVWTTDIAAYFTGRAIGGPKLWPRISPNKTWAGFWGGAVGGSLAGWLVSLAAETGTGGAPLSAGGVLALSFLASIVGQGGDLAESALKRRAGVKDSGWIIPGHGGVLDRVDSFLAVCLLVAIGLASGVPVAH